MKQMKLPTEAGRQYAEAYEAHYETKNVNTAFVLYNRVIEKHPDSGEADYCLLQLLNILKAVVPKQEIAEAMQQLMFVHLEQTATPVVDA